MGMDGTLEIDKESGKPVRKGMYCSHAQMLFVFITACIIITGVGLLAYYVPDRCQDITATEAPGKLQRELQPRHPTEPPSSEGDVLPFDQRAKDWAGRLSTDVLPKRYSLTLQPFLTLDDATDSKLRRHFTFDGEVSIKVECNTPTKTITLHTKNLTLHKNPMVKSLSAGAAGADLFESYTFVNDYDFLVITLKEELEEAQDYEISIEYSGELNENLYGFYRSSYTTADGEKR